MSKENDPLYILNPQTNHYVLKSGKAGKAILAEHDKKNKKIQALLNRPYVPPMSILVLDRLGLWQVLPLAHFVAGIEKVRSVLLDVHQDKELIINQTCLTFLVATILLLKKQKSVMLESVQNIKWVTLIDSLNFSDTIILNTNFYLMLVQVLTGTGKDLYPYWKESYKELSLKLWLPKLIDLQGSQLIYSDSSLDCVDAKSWFTIKIIKPSLELKNNSLKMSSTSCMSTLVESMESEEEQSKKTPIVKPLTSSQIQSTRKIRIYPNSTLNKLLLTWIAGTNCIYNKIVYHQSTSYGKYKNMSEYDLRERFVNEKIVTREKINNRANTYVLNQGMFRGQPVNGGNMIVHDRTGNKILKGRILSTVPNPHLNPWVSKIPKVVRAGAVKDYCGGRQAAWENLKAGNIGRFTMRYRKNSDRIYPALHLEQHISSKTNGKHIILFPGVLKKAGISNPNILVNKHDREFVSTYIGNKPSQDCKLKYNLGHWYLHVPYTHTVTPPEKDKETRGMCGIDPGVDPTLNIYDAEKLTVIHYKKKIHDKIQRKLQLLQSLRDKKQISTHSYKKARKRLRRKWIYLRDEMHYKCADYLVSKYKVIGLPPFETSNMVSNTGYLNKKTKIEMINWGHYKFKQKLQSKARNMSYVLNTDESYTTQGCTNCGTLKYMGSDKIYSCLKCGNVIGRNDGSSRSIFMCTMHKRIA